jgi:hypothetical protein
MARATNKEMNARVDTLAKMLLTGAGNSGCIVFAQETWGLSRCQGYRVLKRAWAQIEQDAVESGCERRALLAWCIDRLQAAVGNALEKNNHGAAVSGIRELNLLVGLGSQNHSGVTHRR